MIFLSHSSIFALEHIGILISLSPVLTSTCTTQMVAFYKCYFNSNYSRVNSGSKNTVVLRKDFLALGRQKKIISIISYIVRNTFEGLVRNLRQHLRSLCLLDPEIFLLLRKESFCLWLLTSEVIKFFGMVVLCTSRPLLFLPTTVIPSTPLAAQKASYS